jgi:hypothetical protein
MLQVQIDSARERVPAQNANSLCPRVRLEQAMAMRRRVEKLFAVEGSIAEKKQLLRIRIQEVKLARNGGRSC